MPDQTIVLPKAPREALIARISRVLGALPVDRAWAVLISEYRPKRSSQQNNYLNGVAYKILSEHTGYERDEISEYLCGTYFGWREKPVPKKPSNPDGTESVPKRTTTTGEDGSRSVLSKLEFVDYVAFVQRFAAQKGVYIPDPEVMQ